MPFPVPESLVIFTVEGQPFALGLSAVDRVVRAVEVVALPGAPACIRGAIDVHGEIMPVFDLRERLHLPTRPISLNDCLIIARTRPRRVALIVDSIERVIDGRDADVTDASEVIPGLDSIAGLLSFEGGLVLVQDLERFLSRDEEEALEAALTARG